MAILVQSQGIISFGIFGATVAKVAKVAKVAMGLDHERSGASCLLDCKEISGTGTGTVLGSWGNFFVGILVFVILTFFEEGIGNNLTMPLFGSWVLVLESWVLEMGLGTWVRDL
jgi:hypothetical protein